MIGLIAHVDTSPEASGGRLPAARSQSYDGGEIRFSGDAHQALRPDENPVLAGYAGHDLVTSDGTTLLGADDKAGVAEITGRGRLPGAAPGAAATGRCASRSRRTRRSDRGRATSIWPASAPTWPTPSTARRAGEIEDETFSACRGTITIRGHNIHPGYARGKMVNSIKLAAALLSKLPQDGLSPETTEGREGYVHPMAIEGGVEETVLRFIVRDFDADALAAQEALLQRLADEVAASEPRARVTVEISRSYRNMKEYLAPYPRALEAAEEAVRRAGLTPRRAYIRGGTDGARLSEQGLPTPNLFTGVHDYHSVREWISVQDMGAATATLIHLAQVWAEPATLIRGRFAVRARSGGAARRRWR